MTERVGHREGPSKCEWKLISGPSVARSSVSIEQKAAARRLSAKWRFWRAYISRETFKFKLRVKRFDGEISHTFS